MKKIILLVVAMLILATPVLAMRNVYSDGYINTDVVGKYLISDTDTTSDPSYFGFSAIDGSWYIMENNVASGTYRYVTGASGYAAAWTDRGSQTYTYPNTVIWY